MPEPSSLPKWAQDLITKLTDENKHLDYELKMLKKTLETAEGKSNTFLGRNWETSVPLGFDVAIRFHFSDEKGDHIVIARDPKENGLRIVGGVGGYLLFRPEANSVTTLYLERE